MWQFLQRLRELLKSWLRHRATISEEAQQPLCSGDRKELATHQEQRRLPEEITGLPLEENWLSVFSFLTAEELSRAAALQSALRRVAEHEDLWRHLCGLRWEGKQWMPSSELFRNGNYRGLQLTVAECRSLLRRRNVKPGHCTEKSELMEAVNRSSPNMAGHQGVFSRSKWKRSYVHAELDRKRTRITVDEVAHFRWHLIYHGRPSSMGHRHFQKNGVFVSPHFGETTWSLEQDGQLFQLEGMAPLKVHRDPDTWGWILGAGSSTEYLSVEMTEK
ncbi:unnamed protein product [Durusdinium trenchii]|uniref:F-box domain-containing protein n=2 Tax=Durusdinium trenchii TaxID=1381693 RepID=A0ABP0LVS0_9DINO